MPGLIPKVNEANEVIGECTITEAKENGWPRRITRVFLLSEDRQNILLQKRSDTVPSAPGVWDLSGGHVDLGESYFEAGKREVKEELGIEVNLEPLNEVVRNADFFAQIMTTTISGSTAFTLDTTEVSEVQWVPVKEVDSFLAQNEVTDWLLDSWQRCRDTLLA